MSNSLAVAMIALPTVGSDVLRWRSGRPGTTWAVFARVESGILGPGSVGRLRLGRVVGRPYGHSVACLGSSAFVVRGGCERRVVSLRGGLDVVQRLAGCRLVQCRQ